MGTFLKWLAHAGLELDTREAAALVACSAIQAHKAELKQRKHIKEVTAGVANLMIGLQVLSLPINHILLEHLETFDVHPVQLAVTGQHVTSITSPVVFAHPCDVHVNQPSKTSRAMASPPVCSAKGAQCSGCLSASCPCGPHVTSHVTSQVISSHAQTSRTMLMTLWGRPYQCTA